MFDYYTDVDILVNGKPIKKFAHNGKLFIQSNHGTEYSIRVRNKGWSRRLFVISVDGINVVDGKAAGSSQMGYILNGQESHEIKGFRTDHNTENAFKFSSKRKSYAAKSDETQGDTRNCGVIGVEVYDEYQEPILWTHTILPQIRWGSSNIDSDVIPRGPTYTCNSSNLKGAGGCSAGGDMTRSASRKMSFTHDASLQNSAGSQMVSANFCQVEEPKRGFDMGTEFSQHEIHSPITTVQFRVGAKLTTVNIYYASRQSLVEMGVPVVYEPKLPTFPQAFPSQFCKPPRR